MIAPDEARTLYRTGDAAHDFDHVLRVMHMAVHLAAAEGADVEIVRAAALLHDVPVGDGRDDHHVAAAEFARRWLMERGVESERADAVAHCIRAHRFRDSSVSPQTLEARVLYDADKLDSMGAIGVARAFAYAGSHGARLWTMTVAEIEASAEAASGPEHTPVHEYVFKLQRLQGTLYTPTAQRIGEARHSVMVAYFAALDAELGDHAG
jgi:uncharacterized protein